MSDFVDCPVCQAGARRERLGYLQCRSCAHEWKSAVPLIAIENDVLDAHRILKEDRLTSAKVNIVKAMQTSKNALLDFGAGSGKFAYFCRPFFHSVQGVEVTPACIAFARDFLSVTLKPSLDATANYDVTTAWHSLEHLPPESLRVVFGQLYQVTREVFVVSVPNAGSWASQALGRFWPYYDPDSHFHQFSPQSLTYALQAAGWRTILPFRMPIYSVFCWAQGLTNVVTRTHNLLYFKLKRGQDRGALSGIGLAAHLAIFAFFVPIAIIGGLIESFLPSKAACINLACYKPKPESEPR